MHYRDGSILDCATSGGNANFVNLTFTQASVLIISEDSDF